MIGKLIIPYKSEKEAEIVVKSIMSNDLKNKRSNVSIKKVKNEVQITIDSSDIVMLRALLNSYCKKIQVLLNVSEVVK